MTHAQIVTKITEILTREAGTSDWWGATEIGQVANDVYRELASTLELCKNRDATLDSVDGTKEYTIALPSGVERVISVLDVTYDGKPLTPVNIFELNNKWWDWRNASEGTPECWFFEFGSENTKISLQRTPGESGKEIAVEMIIFPNELATGESPLWPFTDGAIIIDGAVSYLLAKAGGGRDLDRADFYWAEMMSKITVLQTRPLQKTKVRRLRSIEDTPMSGTFSLGSKYPPYRFE